MKTLRERFDSKWEAVPESGCWLWTAKIETNGYGRIRSAGKGSPFISAHRASWLLYRGDIPKGMVIRHKCDCRSCCNPDHLSIGTQKQNMADMVARGRTGNRGKHGKHARGANQGSAKLDDAKAAAIFLADGLHHEIGAMYGVTKHTVFRIKKRQIWRHVTDHLTPVSE